MHSPTWFGVLAIAAIGCGGSDDGGGGADAGEPDAAGPSPSCLEAAQHSDLEWIQEEIFTPSCAAFGVCHMGNANSAGGLNLEEGMAAANMINVPSQLFPEYDLVVPGDPDSSYLLIILGGRPGPLDEDVMTMPYSSPPLCDEKIEAVARWVESLPAEQ